jgi:hypothetical protein
VANRSQPTAAEAASVAEFRIALRRFLDRTERVAREGGITPHCARQSPIWKSESR